MNLSPQGLIFIAEWEGFRARPYRDSANYWTIGFGHKILPGEKPYTELTREDGLALLKRDASRAENTVNRAVKSVLLQHQYDAVVSLIYNTGSAPTLLSCLNAGHYAQAAAEFCRWCKVTKTINGRPQKVDEPGLLKRRRAEQKLFETGIYDTSH